MLISLALSLLASTSITPPRLIDARLSQVASPADSATILYQRARRTLDGGEIRAALPLFDRVWMEYRTSAEAPKALYWKAFALYRRGGSEDLAMAERMLELLDAWYPEASSQGDGAALLVRVRGRLGSANRACGAEMQASAITTLNEAARSSARDAAAAAQRALADTGPCAEPLREQAVKVLGKVGGIEAETTLVRIARDNQRTEVGYAALSWIGEHATSRSYALLRDLGRTSTDNRTVERVIGAMSRIDAPWVVEDLRAIAKRSTAPASARDYAEHTLAQRSKSR